MIPRVLAMCSAALLLSACGIPLQSDPEPLPSDVVPISVHVEIPSPSPSSAP